MIRAAAIAAAIAIVSSSGVAAGKGRGDPLFRGKPADDLRQAPLGRPSGRIVLRAVHLDETVDVQLFSPRGGYDERALAALDHAFRCRRTGVERSVDPRLYERLSHIYDRFGRTVELVSGVREQENESSRHYHGSAMDIRIDGVSTDELYQFAASLDHGGMGVGRYPHGHFVHVDLRAPGAESYRWTDLSGGPEKLERARRIRRSPERIRRNARGYHRNGPRQRPKAQTRPGSRRHDRLRRGLRTNSLRALPRRRR